MTYTNILDSIRADAHNRIEHKLALSLLGFSPDVKSRSEVVTEYWVSGTISLEIDRLSENSWKVVVTHSHYGFEVYDLCGFFLGDCGHNERLAAMLPEVHRLIDKVTDPIRVAYEMANSVGYIGFLAKNMGLLPLEDVPNDFVPGLKSDRAPIAQVQ